MIGIEPDVVEGETEATLSFTGAVGALTSIEFPAPSSILAADPLNWSSAEKTATTSVFGASSR